MQSSIRILIADDHTLFREGLSYILATDPQLTVVGMAATASDVIALTSTNPPDVILLDVDMPGGGIAALKQLTARAIPSRVILLTGHPGYVVAGVHAGAQGYLLKHACSADILDAIHAVAGGAMYLHPLIQQAFITRLNSATGDGRLSERERDILRLVAQGTGNREIGETLGFSEATVKKFVNAIRAKLGAQDRAHAVAVAKELGLI